MKKEIKFKYKFDKMPERFDTTRLIGVQVVDRSDLHSHFVIYDTAYDGGFYELPTGKLIILFLHSVVFNPAMGQVWTTIRRWTPKREKEYQEILNQEVNIVIL